MDINKLERANILAKSLLPKVYAHELNHILRPLRIIMVV